jgi:hypothetical protein
VTETRRPLEKPAHPSVASGISSGLQNFLLKYAAMYDRIL